MAGNRTRGAAPRIRRLGAAAVVVFSVLAGVLGIEALDQRVADARARERTALGALESLRIVDGLEWRAVAGEDLAALAASLGAQEGRLRETHESLGLEHGEPLAARTHEYLDAVQDLLAALAVGDRELAEAIDEERVDPAFEEAVEDLNRLAFAESERAASTLQRSRQLIWGGGVIGALALALLVWFLLGSTHARAAAQAAAAADRRFRTLIEGSTDAFTVVDDSDRLVPVGGGLARMFGVVPNEGSHLSELVPRDQFARWVEADERVRSGEGHQVVVLDLPGGGADPVVVEARGDRHPDQPHQRVWVWRDDTARKELEEALIHRAFHDALTGVANRDLLQDRIGRALKRSRRSGAPVSLLFCDLDDFKAVNDSLGHGVGDELLGVVSARLQGCLRETDTLARLGGDEFAVLLEDADEELALTVAQRVIDVVGYEVDLAGRSLHPSVSIGIATATAESTTESLLRDADTAMYEAKRTGKGCASAYHHSMRDDLDGSLELRSDLRGALDRGELSVVYQPTVGLHDGEIEGFEALARWTHPRRGKVPPQVFIPVAEATGDVVAIGRYVLREACRTAVMLQDAARRPLSMHVNLSPRQLGDPGIVDTVRSALAETGLGAECLVLEVTEGTLLDNRGALARLHELHDLGVRAAVDDFGTGYTSLSYLRQLPIDILKIDRSFVSGDALPSGERTAFLNAIIGLAGSLGVQSVAEGVEELRHLGELRSLGCDSAQGFLWSEGLDAGAAWALLSEATAIRDAATR